MPLPARWVKRATPRRILSATAIAGLLVVFWGEMSVDVSMRSVVQEKQQAFNTAVNATTDSSSSSSSSSSSTPTAWCILDENNSHPGHFNHFPHAAETILPCWSYFCQERERRPKAKCGFWIDSAKLELVGWTKDLVAAMGCVVSNNEQQPQNMDLYHRPPKYHRTPWFQNVSHANLLRKQIGVAVTRESRQDGKRLHIGLVQRKRGKRSLLRRKGNRNIRNLANIQKRIEERYPNATVETRHMEGMNFTQQAVWWSRQDVVVAAHGAAVTNLIFLPVNGSVIELYPDHYYPIHFYKSLSDASGIVHAGWYNGVEDTESDYRQHSHNIHDRNRYRNVDLKPPVHEVLELIEEAVG